MSRPSSVTIASWIWLFCGLFTTLTIADVLSATNLLAFVVEIGGTADELSAVPVIGWLGTIIATALAAAMIAQVVAAVKLRDGARWARVLLTIAAGITLVAALWDITLWSAWVLLAAHMVALVLAYGDSATAFLEARTPDREWDSVDA
ncbi:hypothetical protein [Dietzia sp. B32]|uniref:hypothetical protein n=1 Tax=Dietzia sp. B32 TaxID=2915130 RepID=UPI0021AD63EC|nr:hypothetical protein [Dietzia sp. B32]UVE96404.1 hypothetical protein L8M95_06440 [Dietzia sp. B32]